MADQRKNDWNNWEISNCNLVCFETLFIIYFCFYILYKVPPSSPLSSASTHRTLAFLPPLVLFRYRRATHGYHLVMVYPAAVRPGTPSSTKVGWEVIWQEEWVSKISIRVSDIPRSHCQEPHVKIKLRNCNVYAKGLNWSCQAPWLSVQTLWTLMNPD